MLFVLNYWLRQKWLRILRNPARKFTSSDRRALLKCLCSSNQSSVDEIYSLQIAGSLPTLPFEVFRQLLVNAPLTTDDGVLLRRMCLELGAMHLVLNCLGIFTHQSQHVQSTPGGNVAAAAAAASTAAAAGGSATASSESASHHYPHTGGSAMSSAPTTSASDDKGHMYWAKGTGFGTGSTTKSWDVEQALQRQRTEEEHVTIFLQVLSSYINPAVYHRFGADDDDDDDDLEEDDDEDDEDEDVYDADGNEDNTNDANAGAGSRPAAAAHKRPSLRAEEQQHSSAESALPARFQTLLAQSCLIPALCSYLRNDSVLDITRHIPLYRAILQLLRALALNGQLVTMLLPQPQPAAAGAEHSSDAPSVTGLLVKMKSCVDTYASRLK